MKHSLVICISALVFFANVQGATYVTDFNSFDDQLDVAGQDGWAINDPTVGLSFIAVAGTKAAALGGYYGDSPLAATVALTHTYGYSLGTTLMSFNFVLVDSNNIFTARDTFGVTLRNGTSNLFTVYFSPFNQSGTPGADSNGQWNLSYNTGSDPTVSLTQGVLEGGYYSFYLQFTPNGSATDFELKVAGGNTVVRTGNIAVDPTTLATDFGLTWTPTFGAANAGSNFVVVDDFSVVPEASSSLLCLILATLVTTHHRRRAC